jgi:hypothetical protein
MPDFEMQKQNEHLWCWAAVAVSIHQFLDPASSIVWTQENLATQVLRNEGQISGAIDCSLNPDLCNFPARLDDALSVVGNLAPPVEVGILSFTQLTQWIDRQLPVCARIVWYTGNAHFIALDGYRVFSSGAQQIHVQDPIYGPSYQFYEDLCQDYPPGGSWQDTYTVKA